VAERDPFETAMLRGAALALRRRADRQAKDRRCRDDPLGSGSDHSDRRGGPGRAPFLGPRRSRRGL